MCPLCAMFIKNCTVNGHPKGFHFEWKKEKEKIGTLIMILFE